MHTIGVLPPMMTGFISRMTVILIGLFSVMLVVTRAQPIVDHSIQGLRSGDCSAPCFMGIYPGMKITDAVKVLEQHPWVEGVDNRTLDNNGGFVYWRWKADVPDWIDHARRGTIWVNDKRITQFWLDTRYQLGDLLLRLGAPDVNILDDDIDNRQGIYQYRGVHAADGLVLMSWQRCLSGDRYHSVTSLKFRNVIGSDELESIRYLDKWQYRFKNCDH